MRIGKYYIDITEFESKFWERVEIEYEGEHKDLGVVYHRRGWLWFVVSYKERYGWNDVDVKANREFFRKDGPV